MHLRFHTLGALLALLLAPCLGGCAAFGSDPSPVVAEGEGLSITLEELDARVKQALLDERTGGSESKLYELRAGILDEWIAERVLAAEAERRGTDVDALLASEARPVGPEEIEAFFEENRARLPDDTTLEDVEEPIRQHLEEREREAAAEALVARADVQVHLSPPRLDVAAVGPSLGPEDAPVTIIEFADFQCPYCRRAVSVMKELHERYPEQLRIVYRHLPLESIHPRARAAAVASVCADAQDRFWVFHDRLYTSPGALDDAGLRAHADAAGLDLEAYDACLSEDDARQVVSEDIQAARSVGLTGTPAFLVNGVLVTGAHPVEVFERMIERDLAAAGDGTPPPASAGDGDGEGAGGGTDGAP